ncbi:MAG TPA: N-acetyltransferase [Dongiaceae bacterium]|jgi:predicted N-acetyltransferase YhbS
MKIIHSDFQIRPAPSHSARAVEHLYDNVFGGARFQKASHRFREGVESISELNWVAMEGDRLVGAIRYWPILVGNAGHQALLLGPLAVTPNRIRRGIGSALMLKTLSLAAYLGHDLVLLVGDPDYYGRFGFVPASPRGFIMPGEKRPDRLQVKPLKALILDRVSGALRRADTEQLPAAAHAGLRTFRPRTIRLHAVHLHAR